MATTEIPDAASRLVLDLIEADGRLRLLGLDAAPYGIGMPSVPVLRNFQIKLVFEANQVEQRKFLFGLKRSIRTHPIASVRLNLAFEPVPEWPDSVPGDGPIRIVWPAHLGRSEGARVEFNPGADACRGVAVVPDAFPDREDPVDRIGIRVFPSRQMWSWEDLPLSEVVVWLMGLAGWVRNPWSGNDWIFAPPADKDDIPMSSMCELAEAVRAGARQVWDNFDGTLPSEEARDLDELLRAVHPDFGLSFAVRELNAKILVYLDASGGLLQPEQVPEDKQPKGWHQFDFEARQEAASEGYRTRMAFWPADVLADGRYFDRFFAALQKHSGELYKACKGSLGSSDEDGLFSAFLSEAKGTAVIARVAPTDHSVVLVEATWHGRKTILLFEVQFANVDPYPGMKIGAVRDVSLLYVSGKKSLEAKEDARRRIYRYFAGLFGILAEVQRATKTGD